MEALEQFRQETRTWLEENCPPSMRTPMPEEETVWGGRNATYPNPDSKLWLDRMASLEETNAALGLPELDTVSAKIRAA